MSVGKYSYTEDLTLFFSMKATAMIKHKIQCVIDTLAENTNNLSFLFSGTKTNCVHFSQKRGKQPDPMLSKATGPDVKYKRGPAAL